MANYGGVQRLAATIAEAVTANGDKPAEQGVYSGGAVELSDGLYPAVLAVDMPLKDGDFVWAVRSAGGNAVIVGA